MEKQRAPRKRISIVNVIVDGAEIDAKECTKCGEVKTMAEFYPKKSGLGNRESACLMCRNEYFKTHYEINKDRKADDRLRNRERNRRTIRTHYQRNKDDYLKRNERRREVESSLPSIWTASNRRTVVSYFSGTCCLTHLDMHIDHVIPLAWGHGGSYIGNMIPLRPALNDSKSDAHVFTWFDANRQRFELDESRWAALIEYLADTNGLTASELRSYVDWCYVNQRHIDGIIRDNERYGYVVSSLELWREATGIPFPIRIDFGEKKTDTKRSVRTRKNPPQISASEA